MQPTHLESLPSDIDDGHRRVREWISGSCRTFEIKQKGCWRRNKNLFWVEEIKDEDSGVILGKTACIHGE